MVSGITYPTAEHFMMAGKARLFGDEAVALRILETTSPGDAKTLGRAVSGYDDKLWAERRYGLVVEGNTAKFGQNNALAEYLTSTGNRVLVEASPTDRIWGIGLAVDDSRTGRPSQWPGLNLLGFALMDVREHLADRARKREGRDLGTDGRVAWSRDDLHKR